LGWGLGAGVEPPSQPFPSGEGLKSLPFGKPRARQCAMAKVIAYVIARPLIDPAELVRGSLVIGCALALILAGPFWPSGL